MIFTFLEKKILDRVQTDFPVCENPYDRIAIDAGCTLEEAHATVLSLRKRGIIRRIGAVFVSNKLGYTSCLVAARVDPAHLESAAARAGAHDGVTHNYEREGSYNLWFTVIAQNSEAMEAILNDVRQCEGVQSVYALPSLETFKIRVDFKFQGEK